MNYAHVVACSSNDVIGHKGQLPWHLPEDLRRFKKLTMDHILIMGRKTYESISRPLPGRFSIVVSRQDLELPRTASLVHSLEEAYALAESLAPHWGDEVYIIGGGEIYRQSMAKIKRVYLTRVHVDIAGDTTYPQLDLQKFTRIQEEKFDPKPTAGQLPFTQLVYERIEP